MIAAGAAAFNPVLAIGKAIPGRIMPPLQHGFTLLELLVALAVFAIMSVAAYSGLRSVLFTKASVEAQAQRLAKVQMAFYFLERDIEQILPRHIRDEYGQTQPALQSGGSSGELITFTRAGWDNPIGQPRANLERLAYRLEETRLLRLHWNSLDRGSPEEPRATPLLDEVKEVKMRFLGAEEAWQTEWGTPENVDALPRALEVSVTLNDWGEITRLFLLPGY